MDCLSIGRGIADVLPESIKAAGAKYVTLNHCEKRLPFNVLEKTANRAREVGLGVITVSYTHLCERWRQRA